MSESVKVCEKELEKLAELAECWDEIASVLSKYVGIMQTVHAEAIKKGHINSAVGNLYHFSARFHKYSVGLGAQASTHANKLADKIEKIDLDLYNEV